MRSSPKRAVGGATLSKPLDGAAFDIAMSSPEPVAFEAAARAVGFLGFGFHPRGLDAHPPRPGAAVGRQAWRRWVRRAARSRRASWLMRNALADGSRGRHTVVAAAIRQALDPPDRVHAGETWRKAAERLRPRWPKLADLMDASEHDMLACMGLRPDLPQPVHWTVCRLRLIGAVLLEQVAANRSACLQKRLTK